MQLRVERSRCTNFIPAKYSIPQAICTAKLTSCRVLMVWWRLGVPLAFLKNWLRSACFSNGITNIGDWFGCNRTPTKCIKFLWRNFLMSNASLMNFDKVLFSSGVGGARRLMATGVNLMLSTSSSSLSLPWYTLLVTPPKW